MAGDCRFDCNCHFIHSYPCFLSPYVAFTCLCKVSETLNSLRVKFLGAIHRKLNFFELGLTFFFSSNAVEHDTCLYLSLNRLIVAARLVRVLLFIRIVTEKDQLERATRRMVRTWDLQMLLQVYSTCCEYGVQYKPLNLFSEISYIFAILNLHYWGQFYKSFTLVIYKCSYCFQQGRQ